jgi:hypothetical protein
MRGLSGAAISRAPVKDALEVYLHRLRGAGSRCSAVRSRTGERDDKPIRRDASRGFRQLTYNSQAFHRSGPGCQQILSGMRAAAVQQRAVDSLWTGGWDGEVGAP